MSNNVAVANVAGQTTTVKTTETGGVHVPHHNLDGIAAGQTLIGKTGEKIFSIEVTPTVSASPDYSTGDVVGSIMTFASPAVDAAGDFTVRGAVVRSKADITVACDLLLFNALPTATYTDNSAVAVGATDLAKLVGVIKFASTDATDLGTEACLSKEANIPVKLASGNNVYGVLVARGTINLASTSDITVMLTVRQN